MNKGKVESLDKKRTEKQAENADSEEQVKVETLKAARKLAREIFGEGAVISRAVEYDLAEMCFDDGERNEVIEFVIEARNLTEQLVSGGKWTPEDALSIYNEVFDTETLEYLESKAEGLAAARDHLEEVYPGEPVTVEAIVEMYEYLTEEA